MTVVSFALGTARLPAWELRVVRRLLCVYAAESLIEHEQLTSQILGAAIEVHSVLGPGMLESAYEACLCHELALRDLAFECQVQIPVEYKDVRLDCGYRADVIVQGAVLLELKAIGRLGPIHEAQLMTYLKLSGCRVGLLLNFGELRLKDGIIRRVVG